MGKHDSRLIVIDCSESRLMSTEQERENNQLKY